MLRFGTELFKSICEFGGATLVFTDSAAEQTDEESLCSDVLAVITHFSAKTHGKRSAKSIRVRVAEGTILDICRWSAAGHSNRHIAKRLVAEGRATDERGRPITLRVVRRVVKENSATIATLHRQPTSSASIPNSFGVFCSQRVRQTTEATRMLRKTLVTAYHAWCKGRGEVPLSDRAVSNYVRSHFPSVHRNQKHGHGGATIYLGLSLLPEG